MRDVHISITNLPDERARPSFNLRPTSFDFNFYVQILEQELSGSTLTFLKEVRGSYNIYKVQDLPNLNERHYYGRGTVSVGNLLSANCWRDIRRNA